MDGASHDVLFESLRSQSRNIYGFRRRAPRREKKLVYLHKELTRQCVVQVRQHEYDVRVATSALQRQQKLEQARLERLRQAQNAAFVRRESTRCWFRRQEEQHKQEEQGRRSREHAAQLDEAGADSMTDAQVIVAIGNATVARRLLRNRKMQQNSGQAQ